MEAQKCTEKRAYRPVKHCSSAKSLYKSTASLIRPVICLIKATRGPSLKSAALFPAEKGLKRP